MFACGFAPIHSFVWKSWRKKNGHQIFILFYCLNCCFQAEKIKYFIPKTVLASGYWPIFLDGPKSASGQDLFTY